MKKPKLIRITTVPISLNKLLEGQLHYMSDYFEVIGVSSPGDLLQEVGEREGIRVEAIEMTREITPVKDFQGLRKMIKFLKEEKPDIVHTHTPKAGIVGMLAAKIAKVPHRLHTVAGMPLMESTGAKRNILQKVEALTYRCATRVLPNSKGLYEFILNEKLTKPEKLEVIAQGSTNGIDSEHFNPKHFSEIENTELRESLKIDPSDFVFIFVGRLVGDKGINELVAAFEKLNQNKAAVKLLLVGSLESDLDPLSPETEKIIETNSAIKAVGFQKDVRPYFAISDVLAFPSYREGFPNVVMQAGAMGLPCIVSDINGCNEIIENGKNGLIIPPKNETGLFAAMEKMMEKSDLELMQSKARESITSRFQNQVVWGNLKTVYQSLF
jgi:glycosyltransferase involved in cell wall biosynthesis